MATWSLSNLPPGWVTAGAGVGHGLAPGWVTAGAGVTWASPPTASFDDELSLALMFGGGTIVPIGKSVGLRFDARGKFMLTDIRLSGICGGVGYSINFASGGGFHFEGLVALSFGF